MALTWVKYSDGMPLSGAVIGGYDQGNPLYVARALHEGCIVPGKFHAVYKTSYISWAGKELEKKEGFDLLLGSALDWKPAADGSVPDGAVEGGRRPDGGPLYIARAKVNGVESIGKLNPQHKFCHIPYGGTEHLVKRYEVLVNAPASTTKTLPQGPANPTIRTASLQQTRPTMSSTATLTQRPRMGSHVVPQPAMACPSYQGSMERDRGGAGRREVGTFRPASGPDLARVGSHLPVNQGSTPLPSVLSNNNSTVTHQPNQSSQQLQLQLLKQQEQLQEQLQLTQKTADLLREKMMMSSVSTATSLASGSRSTIPYPSIFTKTTFTPADLRTVKESDPAFMTAWHAETHFYKMMSQTGKTNVKVKSLTVVQNPKLKTAFDAKMAEFLRNSVPADPVFAYHGTKSDESTLSGILKDNFDMKYAKRQAHGPGHYFSEYPDVSLG